MPKAHANQNYLDFIPVKNAELECQTDENGLVTLEVEWKGFYHRLAQKIFHRPRVSRIALDEYGSFIWLALDGRKDVHQLSQELVQRFGDMDKGMSRLIKFLEILRDHHFITWKEDKP